MTKRVRRGQRMSQMETDNRYGTLFVNEVGMPVRHVAFRRGEGVLYAEALVKDMPEGPTNVRFHAPDGSVVFVAEVQWPKVEVEAWADTLTIELPLRLVSSKPGEPWAKGVS